MNDASQTDSANVGMQDSDEQIQAQAQEDTNYDSLFNDLDNPSESISSEVEKTEEVKSGRPEYWPEDLWDQEADKPKFKETIDKISKYEKMAEDMRKKLSNKDKVPEKYEYEGLPESIANEAEVIDAFSRAAKEAGLTNHQANTVLNNYIEQIGQEDGELMTAKRNAEIEKLGENAESILMQIKNFADVRVARGTFSQEEASALLDSITTAEGARALAKAIEMTGEMAIPSSFTAQSQSKSIEDVKGLMVEAYKIKDRSTREKELSNLRNQLSKFE